MSSNDQLKSLVDVSIGIDKIKLQMPFTGSDDPNYKAVRSLVYAIGDHQFDVPGLPPSHFKKLKKPAAMTWACLPLPSGGSLIVKYGGHSGHLRVWIEFNPSKSCLSDLAYMFELLFVHGFETIYQLGRAYYIEINIDVRPAAFVDYMYMDTKLQAVCDLLAGQGTVYVGSRAGRRSFTIYDKSKQCAEVHKLLLPQQTLRIEAKLRDSGRLATSLGCLPNPFTTLRPMRRVMLALLGVPASSLTTGEGVAKFLAAHPDMVACATPEWWAPVSIFAALDTDRWVQPLRQAGIYGASIIGDLGQQCLGSCPIPPAALFGHPAIDCKNLPV